MFFVNCIVTFFDLTKPASSIVNPAAIQNTKNPLTKNNKEFKIKTVSVCTPHVVWAAVPTEGIKNARIAIT